MPLVILTGTQPQKTGYKTSLQTSPANFNFYLNTQRYWWYTEIIEFYSLVCSRKSLRTPVLTDTPSLMKAHKIYDRP